MPAKYPVIPAVAVLPIATLLALLRAGEQSAAHAFSRISHRLSAGELQIASSSLQALIADEQRHDDALATHCGAMPQVAISDAPTRRFFRALESREPIVHLARVAALDSCVCQVLTRVLVRTPQAQLGSSLTNLLLRIRADEAQHVRVTRTLARAMGADIPMLRVVSWEVRQAFSALLVPRAAAFEALGVDSGALISRIRRD